MIVVQVRIVEEDYETIDKANILPRARRSAALASGLVRANAGRSVPTVGSNSSAGAGTGAAAGGRLSKSHERSGDSNSDSDGEAEF